MTYNNFSISRRKGKLYLKSKEPKEGYEEVTYGEGKKTYHQYHDRIKGVPEFFGVKEINYQGRTLRFLELSLKDGETLNKVSVNLKNKGGYTDEAKALLSVLRDLELGEEVSLSAVKNVSEGKNGKTYENLNIYINYLGRKDENDKNPSTGFIHYADIPKPVKKEVAGDIVWDFSPQTEFYYQVFQEIESRFKEGSSNHSSEQLKQDSSQPKTKTTAEEEGDDLPF